MASAAALLMLLAGVAMVAMAAGIATHQLWKRAKSRDETNAGSSRWQMTLALVCLAWGPSLIALALIVTAMVAPVHVS